MLATAVSLTGWNANQRISWSQMRVGRQRRQRKFSCIEGPIHPPTCKPFDSRVRIIADISVVRSLDHRPGDGIKAVSSRNKRIASDKNKIRDTIPKLKCAVIHTAPPTPTQSHFPPPPTNHIPPVVKLTCFPEPQHRPCINFFPSRAAIDRPLKLPNTKPLTADLPRSRVSA